MRMIKPILILPGTALVFVPGILLWIFDGTRYEAFWARPDMPHFWIALACAAPALVLMVGTVRLFVTIGQGTPAPWDPPAKLVVRGPYRYVRNPMITGVVLFVLAEAMMLESPPIACWMAFFLVTNMIYFPLSEEPGLERRFGEDYRVYKAHVPRWIPRLTPWSPPENAAEETAGRSTGDA